MKDLNIIYFIFSSVMVLESLMNPVSAEKHPSMLLLYGFLYASVGIFLGLWIFHAQSSLIMVFLTVMACVPLMYNIIKAEEKKDLEDMEEVALLKEHWKAIQAFMYLFIGITIAMSLWYIVLPNQTIEVLFSSQTEVISSINGRAIEIATGSFTSSSFQSFTTIFFNNVKVLIFCILFSFLYGAGAIFILTWNASVIGTAIGNFVRTGLAKVTALAGFEKTTHYFTTISLGFFKYVIHGVPEILAYFVAGLAGGIVSIAIIRHDFGSRKFEHVILDAADLLILSVVILLVAAILEVWITPVIFPI